MVDPIPEEELATGARRLKLAFVALVGLSAGLIAVQGGAGPLGIGLVVLAGAAVGLVLAVLVLP